MRIALADDERETREQISLMIREAGYLVDVFSNGTDIQTALHRDTYDVVLLDWNMPGLSGFEVLEWAAANIDFPPPCIMLTSRQDKRDVVAGLEAGAADFIIKPEAGEVILARIEAAARRSLTKVRQTQQSWGPFEVDLAARTIKREGEEIVLTAKEFDLAVLLFENLDRPLSRGYLFSRIWGGNVNVETRTIDMHVSRLRSKLGLTPEIGFVIKTVFGFGYRMDNSSAQGENCESHTGEDA